MIDIVQIFEDAATAAEYEFAYGRKDIQNWQLTESVALESGKTVLLVDPFVETAEIDNSIIFKWSVRTTIALGKKFDTYTDLFLPSKDLLDSMRTNLYLEGVGGLSAGSYWSSSEATAGEARSQVMGTGEQQVQGKAVTYRVRACRSFTALLGAYSLRDTGPSGGLICYIDGTTFYEAAPSDQSAAQAWSNIEDVEIGATAQGTAIGTGQANTDAIIAQAGHTASAAKLCDDLEVESGSGTYAQLDETELQKHDRRLQAMRSNMETLIKTIFCNEDLVLTAAVILREINQFDENIDIIAAEITFNYDS